MSRFFRTVHPFIKNVFHLSTPFCVALSAATAVPASQQDASSYVQDVFQTLEQDSKSRSVQMMDAIKTQPDAPNYSESDDQYLARVIDHTVLKPQTTEAEIRKMCQEAIDHNFYSVCVNPCWVSLCQQQLSGSSVKICCVVGFPLGANTSQIKAMEAKQAVADGAHEVDMVMNVGYAKAGNWSDVTIDIVAVVNALPSTTIVKVIIETCLLSDDEIVEACKCATRAGASFVKTSTGFAGGGATEEHVRMMRQTVDQESVAMGYLSGTVLVKASGGIRDNGKAKQMLQAGANRIGASAGLKIIGASDTTDLQTKEY